MAVYNLSNMKELLALESIQLKNGIIRYNKEKLSPDLYSTVGLFRSVILDDGKIVGYAPPKSILYTTSIDDKDIRIEEFIEGTMINVFYTNSKWEIATRSHIGANTHFYKDAPSFREMFFDMDVDFSNLNKEWSYSFVMQHPDNKIVIPLTFPRLYLVAVYSIDNVNNMVTPIDRLIYEPLTKLLFPCINFPKILEPNTISKPNTLSKPDWKNMGVILYNTVTGERSKIRNPYYEYVRRLKGNQPNIFYHYLCLRQTGQIYEFLEYFSEYNEQFITFEHTIYAFKNTLFSNYVSCYIKKEKPLIEFSTHYRTHMFTIHQYYLNILKPNSLYVKNKNVVDYINNMHPSLLISSLALN